VTFDPGNPYRRKSSLVTSEAVTPTIRRSDKKTDCIVHQFLEGQRRERDGGSSSTSTYVQEPDPYDEHVPRRRTFGRTTPIDAASSNGHCKSKVVDMDLDSSDDSENIGQVDQEIWTSEITKSVSELDVAAHEYNDNHEIYSHLLTKRQLSDMAWGVRELSRRLSSVKMKFRVKSIFLLTKIHDEDLILKTRGLTKWLLHKDREVRYTVYVDGNLKDNKHFDAAGLLEELRKDYVNAGELEEKTSHEAMSRRLRFWDQHMCRTRPHMFDFVITLGGDGTVLFASWLFQRIVPPVLSFALGSLGFLTKFDFEDHKNILTTAFREGVTVSLRLRFEGTVMRSQRRKTSDGSEVFKNDWDEAHRKRDLVEELIGEEKDDEHTHWPDGTYEILNEIVVDRGPNPSEFHRETKAHKSPIGS
jgi:NAD+ kinase